MQPDPVAALDSRIEDWVNAAASPGLTDADRERLLAMARSLIERGMPELFIVSALQSTARTLEDLRGQVEASDAPFNRVGVQQFIAENGAVCAPIASPARREWKQLERERVLNHTIALLRDARRARARHEIKKTRSLLLKVDQRHLRRILGSEGQDLCNQITGLLRTMSSKI